MKLMLAKALLAFLPVSMLSLGSLLFWIRRKTAWSFLQFVGSACLVMVVVMHLFEALRLLPWMGWGLEGSWGHYVDFFSAVLGLTLFPAGFLLHAVTNQHVK